MNLTIDSMINFVCEKLSIYDLSTLCNKWRLAEDWFFYFAKMKGCRVPSFNEVRSYLKVRS